MTGNVFVNDVKQGVNNLIQTLNNIRDRNSRNTRRDNLTCDKELGKWVVRLNGVVIEEFFRYNAAQKLITKIKAGLDNKNEN